jgi:hypothetical protein
MAKRHNIEIHNEEVREIMKEIPESRSLQPAINSLLLNASFIDNIGLMHSNRLLLALALTRLGKITNAHQITHDHSDNQTLKQSYIKLIIDNIFEKTNRNTIESELPPGDAVIRHGTSGIAWIYNQLHRLEGGSHFKNKTSTIVKSQKSIDYEKNW